MTSSKKQTKRNEDQQLNISNNSEDQTSMKINYVKIERKEGDNPLFDNESEQA